MRLIGKLSKINNLWSATLSVETPEGEHVFESHGFTQKNYAEKTLRLRMEHLARRIEDGNLDFLDHNAPHYLGRFKSYLH